MNMEEWNGQIINNEQRIINGWIHFIERHRDLRHSILTAYQKILDGECFVKARTEFIKTTGVPFGIAGAISFYGRKTTPAASFPSADKLSIMIDRQLIKQVEQRVERKMNAKHQELQNPKPAVEVSQYYPKRG